MINNSIQPSGAGIQQTRNSSSPSTLNTNTSQTGNSTAGLEKGELIRGEITDIKSGEVSVKLEDGRTLSGKLEGSRDLSIGDKVVFRVEDVSLKNLTLKIIANADFVSADTTIEKALAEAGLAKSSRNNELVKELLNQQMSIDKNTIALLIKQSVLYKDTPLQTLVLMNKYHIPVNEACIRQFITYQNSGQSILNNLNTMADSVAELFNPSGEISYNNYLTRSTGLLNLLLNHNNEASTPDQPINGNTSQPGPDPGIGNINTAGSLSPGNTLNSQTPLTVGNLLSQDHLFNLAGLLQSDPLAESLLDSKFIASLTNGSVDIQTASKTLTNFLNTAKESCLSSDLASRLSALPAMQTILSAGEELKSSSQELAVSIPLSGREMLSKALEDFIPEHNLTTSEREFMSVLKERILTGNITSGEVLTWIQDNMGKAGEDSVKAFLSSKEFSTLIKDDLLKQWTLAPKELTQKDAVERHFESLINQMNTLKEIAEQAAGDRGTNLSGQVSHLQDNFNFIQTLNQFITYVPIPLKLRNQFTDGELYVYTRKKSGRSAADGISVLLHLDMNHLGPLDIYLDLKDTHLTSKFYLDNTPAMNLISSNLPLLKEALEKKGYSIYTEVLEREKTVNVVEDFLKTVTPAASVTRYNFDLRA